MTIKPIDTSIFAIGTLRVDIYVDYDFSLPMTDMEIKLNNFTRKIGGSVYNTCKYITYYSNDLGVTLYTPNYDSLINELHNNANQIYVLTEGEPICGYPVSIVGIDTTGEKRMLSFEAKQNTIKSNIKFEFLPNVKCFYTSFYEVTSQNLAFICSICDVFRHNNLVAMVDLCPLIDIIEVDVIKTVLKSVSILSGNKQEYKKLFEVIGISDENKLFDVFPNIKSAWKKCGSEGAEVRTFDGEYFIEKNDTNQAIKVKNTTGCGDIFNSIIIIGEINKWSKNKTLIEAVKNSKIVAERGML